MRLAKRAMILPTSECKCDWYILPPAEHSHRAEDSQSKSSAASDRPLLTKEEGCPAAGHSTHSSPVSYTTDSALTASEPAPDNCRDHLSLEAAPMPAYPSPSTIDARICIIPRSGSPTPSETRSRYPPRLTTADLRPGPDGLTPLSPRPRRTPGLSMDGNTCAAMKPLDRRST